MTRRAVTTQAEDRQPALGIITARYDDRTVTKLPVWLPDGHALVVVVAYHDGRLTLSEGGR